MQQALAEDIGSGDVTAELIAADAAAKAMIVTEEWYFVGKHSLTLFAALDTNIQIEWYYHDGDKILQIMYFVNLLEIHVSY